MTVDKNGNYVIRFEGDKSFYSLAEADEFVKPFEKHAIIEVKKEGSMYRVEYKVVLRIPKEKFVDLCSRGYF